MTSKKLKKLANELAELELIHQNSSSEEEKSNAEKRILAITCQIMSGPDAFENMAKVDEMVQNKLLKNKEN